MACFSAPDRLKVASGACTGLLLAIAPVAQAQQDERQIERTIERIERAEQLQFVDTSLSIGERSVLDFGGFAALSYLYLTEGNGSSRSLIQPEVSFYGRAVIDGAHTLFVRSRFQYREFSEGDSFDGQGDRWTEPFVDRYWYEFDLRGAMQAYEGRDIDGNFNLRVGRQFIDWGQGLALSETLFAGKATIEYGQFAIDGLIGQTPTDDSITDFDSSRDDYNTETQRMFFGGMVRYDTRKSHEIYAYALWQQDNNQDDEIPQVPLGAPVDFTYDSTYVGIGAQGSITTSLLYGTEFVYEFGKSYSDPLAGAQSREDIHAFAGRFILTYLFKDKGQSRLQFETLIASGDEDRLVTTDTVGGNFPGTDDNAYNSLGFVNTGLAFAPVFSNLLSFRLGGSTMPFVNIEGLRQFQVGADVFFLNKFDSDGPIDEPTNQDMYLGTEFDLSLNYRLTSDFAIVGRYGIFFPGPAIVDDDIRHFLFTGVTLSF